MSLKLGFGGEGYNIQLYMKCQREKNRVNNKVLIKFIVKQN